MISGTNNTVHVLTKTIDLFRQNFNSELKKINTKLKDDHYNILACLIDHDKISQQVICDITKNERSKVTRLIDRLEQLGLVKRNNDKTDRRINIISITASGIQLYERMSALLNNIFIMMVDNLGDENLNKLQNLLEVVQDNLIASHIRELKTKRYNYSGS